jgi:hypothetical protein
VVSTLAGRRRESGANQARGRTAHSALLISMDGPIGR